MERLAPRLVVMDVRMPGMGGVEATRRLKASHPDIVVVLVSVDGSDVDGLDSCGAAAFLRKERLSPQGIGAAWEQYGANGARRP